MTAYPEFLRAANATWGPVVWSWEGDALSKGYSFNVTLPPQSTHRVILPAPKADLMSVQESGEPPWADNQFNPAIQGVLAAKFVPGRPGLELTLTNGVYSFDVTVS
eukprot:TRINITY_DN5493_c0_g1_i1.p2 TRINITY_DN5493_c0_g1~~TRINITY_DN5493_c0_g1_i1.p2  ORF type:complete len:115 (+),score=12.66 TRINITY_DN5493_c0_g1_i1:28-345(+)